MSIHAGELNTAEVAYAAIDDVRKVNYICQVKEIPSADGRNAAMALFRRSPREAEGILLSANLVYRCIRMWMDLHDWERFVAV
jgi:intraflagellar transport protein 80